MLGIFKKSLWTKELTAWYLYDFANSFLYINMIIYFSQWVVVDRGLSDFWYSVPVVIATSLLIFLSPYAGHFGDRTGKHFRVFAGSTLMVFISLLLVVLAGRLVGNSSGVVLALIFFGIYQLFYQLALVPYGAFMKYISNQEIYGKVSGIGFGMSQLGHIAGILLTLPVINGTITFFGDDRLATLLPALLAAMLFFLPSYFVFKRRAFPVAVRAAPMPFWGSFWHNLLESRRYPGVFRLLLSFYLFSDAILTIGLYSAIYLERVFGVSDELKANIFMYVFAGFALGAFVGGTVADRWKHKPTLIWSLLFNTLSIMAIALLPTASKFLIPIYLIFGLTMGTTYASSRSYLASLVPKEKSGTFFGLYVFAERFASIVGPLVWGTVVFLFREQLPLNYRLAAATMALFVLAAIIPLLLSEKEQRYVQNPTI